MVCGVGVRPPVSGQHNGQTLTKLKSSNDAHRQRGWGSQLVFLAMCKPYAKPALYSLVDKVGLLQQPVLHVQTMNKILFLLTLLGVLLMSASSFSKSKLRLIVGQHRAHPSLTPTPGASRHRHTNLAQFACRLEHSKALCLPGRTGGPRARACVGWDGRQHCAGHALLRRRVPHTHTPRYHLGRGPSGHAGWWWWWARAAHTPWSGM